MKKVTIKEIKKWIKGLEENRYRRVYYPDARRVAWFVNNSTLREDEMPETMRKKWEHAKYGKEKFLAKKYTEEILKETLNESKLRGLIRAIINETIKQ